METDTVSPAPSSSKHNIILSLLAIVAFVIIGIVAYQFGRLNTKESSPAQQYIQVTPSPVSQAEKSGKYVTYQHVAFHVGTPIFTVEVPEEWSAYTIYRASEQDDPTTIYLGSKDYRDSKLFDLVREVDISIEETPLAKKDPGTWSAEDRNRLIGQRLMPGTDEIVTVDGVRAQKMTLNSNVPYDRVYFAKGDTFITISQVNASNEAFNHVLSTFRLQSTEGL